MVKFKLISCADIWNPSPVPMPTSNCPVDEARSGPGNPPSVGRLDEVPVASAIVVMTPVDPLITLRLMSERYKFPAESNAKSPTLSN